MNAELRKKAGIVDEPEPAPAPAPDPKAKPSSPNADAAPNAPPEAGSSDTDPASQGEPAEATDPKTGKKMSPWKLVDMFKARAVKAEAEALELRKQVVPEEERKKSTETMAQYEARMKEMQEDLRYYNAEKYDPDIIKANHDYQTSWKRAMQELSEITLTDPGTGQPRPVSANDLLELVNLPLGKAREIADQYFGVFAGDVMAHRKEIRKLFDDKAAKMEELKKTGSTRDEERQQAWRKTTEEILRQVKEIYDAENQRAVTDEKASKYFKERDGDEEWNKRLKQGFTLVDRAYTENAHNPQLSKEERAEIVKRHAAVRNRAASWGALRYENDALKAKLAALEKDIETYKSSTPPAGGTAVPNGATSLVSARDRMNAELVKLARPG